VTVAAVLLLLLLRCCTVCFPENRLTVASGGPLLQPTSLVAEKFHEPVCPVERERPLGNCLGNRIMDQPLPDAFFLNGARCLSSRPIIDETHATHAGRSSCQKLAVSRGAS